MIPLRLDLPQRAQHPTFRWWLWTLERISEDQEKVLKALHEKYNARVAAGTLKIKAVRSTYQDW